MNVSSKISSVIWMLVLSFCFFQVQAKEYNVNTKAGELKSNLKGKELLTTKLTISGQINGTDFKFIREELPYLEVLDLTNAQIVPGGKPYLVKLDSKNKKVKYKVEETDVLPQYALFEIRNLKKIILPSNLKGIVNPSFTTNVTIQFKSKKIPDIKFQPYSTNTVIVPHNLYKQYKKLFQNNKLITLKRDSLPKELILTLNDNSKLKDELDGGGYSSVKRLEIIGDIDVEELNCLSLLSNLEYINLKNVTIKDKEFQEWLKRNIDVNLQLVLNNLINHTGVYYRIDLYYSRLNPIISINDTYKSFLNKLDSLQLKQKNLLSDKEFLI